MSLKDTPVEDHTHQYNLAKLASLAGGALQDHVLGQIPTCQLGALRGTGKALRDLIDAAPITPLLPAAKNFIPAAILPVLRTSRDLQAALRQQGHIMRGIMMMMTMMMIVFQVCSGPGRPIRLAHVHTHISQVRTLATRLHPGWVRNWLTFTMLLPKISGNSCPAYV